MPIFGTGAFRMTSSLLLRCVQESYGDNKAILVRHHERHTLYAVLGVNPVESCPYGRVVQRIHREPQLDGDAIHLTMDCVRKLFLHIPITYFRFCLKRISDDFFGWTQYPRVLYFVYVLCNSRTTRRQNKSNTEKRDEHFFKHGNLARNEVKI